MAGPIAASSDADRLLFVSLYPALRRYAAFVSPSWIDPDDVVQEALYQALRRGPLARVEHPGAYLRKAVLNLASNETRRRNRETSALERLPLILAAEDALPERDLGVLDGLPPITRALMFLVYLEDLPIEQAAAMVGLSGVAARGRLSRARRVMREMRDQTPKEPTP